MIYEKKKSFTSHSKSMLITRHFLFSFSYTYFRMHMMYINLRYHRKQHELYKIQLICINQIKSLIQFFPAAKKKNMKNILNTCNRKRKSIKLDNLFTSAKLTRAKKLYMKCDTTIALCFCCMWKHIANASSKHYVYIILLFLYALVVD